MIALRCVAWFLVFASIGQLHAAEPVTQADLLLRMIDLDRLTRPAAAGETSLLFSSFDRESMKIENGRYTKWDANNDAGQFLKKNDDGWDVLAEVNGPGAIWHVWSSDPNGQIRIEIDGAKTVECAFAELFGGTIAPFAEPFAYRASAAGGFNLYFPIGFGKSVRVLTHEFTGHYQIDATAFPPGTSVAPFTLQLDEDGQKALERVKVALTKGLSEKDLLAGRKTRTEGQQLDVAKNEKLTWDVDRPGTVRTMYVMLTDKNQPREPYFWHDIVVRAYWDGHTEPDIEAPACDFFGAGFRRSLFKGLALGTDLFTDAPFENVGEAWALYCYFPMPIFKSARFELENRTGRKIGLMLQLRIENNPPAAGALQFRARFHREDPAAKFDQVLLETAGKGRIVGCTYSVDTPLTDWWGEGDHKVVLDGAKAPQIWGTGTADYFGAAVPLALFSRPFHAVTSIGVYGKNSACRLQIADAIGFQSGARFTMENWTTPEVKLEEQKRHVSSVAYWYGEAQAATAIPRMKPEDIDVPGLRIPNSVEVEATVQKAPANSILKDKNEVGVEFSGGQAVRIDPDALLAVVLKAAKNGRVKLRVRVHPTRPFESFELLDASGKSLALVKYNRESGGIYDLCEVDLRAGDNAFKVRGVKQPVLDCWILDPLP